MTNMDEKLNLKALVSFRKLNNLYTKLGENDEGDRPFEHIESIIGELQKLDEKSQKIIADDFCGVSDVGPLKAIRSRLMLRFNQRFIAQAP